MMTLKDWQTKWQLPDMAVHELIYMTTPVQAAGVDAESAVQSSIRLEAARNGQRLWRNNSGAAVDSDGRHIRYGLGNDSKKINEQFKSSDLIGITSIEINARMIGQTVGVFTAVECKPGNWVYDGKDRTKAQGRFLHVVRQAGGIGLFANSKEDYLKCIQEHV